MCSYDSSSGEIESCGEDMTWGGVAITIGQVIVFIAIAAFIVGGIVWLGWFK